MIRRMRFVPFLTAALVALWPSPVRPASAPSHLRSSGVPECPPDLIARVAPYLNYQVANFQDWHPRRRDALITTRIGAVPQLCLVTIPRKKPQPISMSEGTIAAGRFDPGDDSRLIFSQDLRGDERYQFFRLDLRDGTATRFTDGTSRNTSLCWSPQGRRAAYLSSAGDDLKTDLFIVDLEQGNTRRQVTTLPQSGWTLLDWSPDETRLLLVQHRSNRESHLYEVNVPTGACVPLTTEGETNVYYSGARYARDGDGFFVVTDRGAEFRYLARFDPVKREVHPLGLIGPGDVEDFDLSSDGRHVVLLINAAGMSTLRFLDLRSGRFRIGPRLPPGVATGLRWHSNSRDVGFTITSHSAPGEVYSVDVRRRTLTRWTDGDGFRNASRVEPERLSVRSFDGRRIPGFLYRPDPRKFPGPRPVLVMIHGGPELQARPQFQGRWNYLLEEMGVALLYPNVRGSTGYGKSFERLDDGLNREDAVKDLGALLDWIAKDPALDSARVGLYGSSYGGYMVLAGLITHGDRLRCGIDVAGISDFPGFLQGTPAYRRDLRRAEYGDDRDPGTAAFLQEISPLTNVKKISRPLLVAHGVNDSRVPVDQSERLIEEIRGGNGTVWAVILSDEGHGFGKRDSVDFVFLALVQFVGRFLL